MLDGRDPSTGPSEIPLVLSLSKDEFAFAQLGLMVRQAHHERFSYPREGARTRLWAIALAAMVVMAVTLGASYRVPMVRRFTGTGREGGAIREAAGGGVTARTPTS